MEYRMSAKPFGLSIDEYVVEYYAPGNGAMVPWEVDLELVVVMNLPSDADLKTVKIRPRE